MNVKCRVFENICPDAVIFEIENTNTILISLYIAPDNSSYRNHEIFSIINFIIKNFKNKHACLIGDLNPRCGTPDIDPINQSINQSKSFPQHYQKYKSIRIITIIEFKKIAIMLGRGLLKTS